MPAQQSSTALQDADPSSPLSLHPPYNQAKDWKDRDTEILQGYPPGSNSQHGFTNHCPDRLSGWKTCFSFSPGL